MSKKMVQVQSPFIESEVVDRRRLIYTLVALAVVAGVLVFWYDLNNRNDEESSDR